MPKRPVRKKPSRIRYEQTHPTVSFRMGSPTYDRLKAAISGLGESFADWVKNHLDQDDNMAKARAETMARERDGLGRDIQARRQQLAKIDGLIRERNRELSAPVEARRTEMLKEVEAERQRRLKALDREMELAVWSRRADLARLDKERGAKKEEIARLDSTVFQKKREVAEVDRAMANRQPVMEQLAKQAMEIARRQGVPALACFNCPGYQVVKSMTGMLTAVVGKAESSGNAAEEPGGTERAPGTKMDGAQAQPGVSHGA